MSLMLQRDLFVGAALFVLSIQLGILVYALATRGRREPEDVGGPWKWEARNYSGMLEARGRVGRLTVFPNGEWEIFLDSDSDYPAAHGKDGDPLRAQIRAMRVYHRLTETIEAPR